MGRTSLPQAVKTKTRDWERTTFGPFSRRAIRGVAEAFFTDPDDPADAGAAARFGWLAEDADDMVSNGSGQLRHGLRLTIVLLELFPIFVVGRLALASSLTLEERVRYLAKVESGTIIPLALLVIAWKTVLTVLYFEHPEAAPRLGYDGRHERYLVALKKKPD